MTGPQKKKRLQKIRTALRVIAVAALMVCSLWLVDWMPDGSVDSWFMGLIAGCAAVCLVYFGGEKS